MVFLGTPHRGADSAQLLSNVLSVVVGVTDKNYVQELIPNSGLLLVGNPTHMARVNRITYENSRLSMTSFATYTAIFKFGHSTKL